MADGPARPEWHGARFGGVRMGLAARQETGEPAPCLARASAWTRASTCTDGDLPGSAPDYIRRGAWPEFGSDAASRGYLGPIN